MIHAMMSNEVKERNVSNIINLRRDQNANDDINQDEMKYLKILHESSPDPDSISMISDYSEMGHEIKQSIRFSDMIMSTYSDLKDPGKSVTQIPNTTTDPNMIIRKYNMLSLAMEFTKWKEANGVASTLSDTAMMSHSPSLVSEYSSAEHCLDSPDCDPECLAAILDVSNIDDQCPLQAHIEHKFEETFTGSTSGSESDSSGPGESRVLRSVRPSWAQSLFHRDTLAKMPSSIRLVTSSIRHYDISKETYLAMMNVSQLQLILNCLMTQIEDLNECLVQALISRDELRLEQTAMVIRVEDLTIKAKNIAQTMTIPGHNSHVKLNTSQTYGIMHKFLSNLMCSPKFASSRLISFFTQNHGHKLPPPEYV